MINIEELKADRAAGTQGDWVSVMRAFKPDGVVAADDTANDRFMVATLHGPGHHANARRIARLPQLEAAYIEAVEALVAIVYRSNNHVIGTAKVMDMRNIALAVLSYHP